MTTTPPKGTAPERGSTDGASPGDGRRGAAADADARAKVLGWARRSVDLIPTSWLITGAGAVLLGATALFGGLEAAATEPTPQIVVGETFAGSDLEMTVVSVELRDDDEGTRVVIDSEKDERVLVVTLDVTNTFSSPRSASASSNVSPVVDGIRVGGVDEKGVVSRADDGAASPILQPDVPARLQLAWVVGADEFHGGKEIALTLPDSTHRVGTSVIRGDYWDDVHVGATLSAAIEEATAP